MAQPASNPKIEELRFKLKNDAKSRLFYPLAEELRKVGQGAEAEQVLRAGLTHHPTYLSAWVSLGRALRELKKDGEAVEALTRALQLDPGNVVAARLLADAYLALGEKVEAIKKYKLVHALLPADEELEAVIARLDAEIHQQSAPPEPVAFAPEAMEAPVVEEESPFADMPAADEPAAAEASPFAAAEPLPTSRFDETSPWMKSASTTPSVVEEREEEEETGDVEPMRAAHDESPFEDAGLDSGYGAAAMAIEQPGGMHVDMAPLAAEMPAPPPVDESDVFAPAEPVPAAEAEDFTNTITMADLYARQGLIDDARHIYENILTRDPDNAAVRAKLAAITPEPEPEPQIEAAPEPEPMPADSPKNAKIERLQNWLSRVGKREVTHV